MISYPAALFTVGHYFDTIKILPNQQKGTETGKESIWINHSIYKCTKIYTIYKEGAIFCYFLIFCCKEVFAWGGITFSKTELTEVGEATQYFQQTLLCSPLLPRQHPLTSTAPCPGQNGTRVPSAPLTAIHPRQQHTDICKLYATKWQTLPLFWNCVCKSYIFTCRLLLFCVLEICCMVFC